MIDSPTVYGNRYTVGAMRFLWCHFVQGPHKDPRIPERAGMTEQRNDPTQESTYKTIYTQFKNNVHEHFSSKIWICSFTFLHVHFLEF
ncbi:hypothetical protein ACRRTK_009389 [Alexandromys fortis]